MLVVCIFLTIMFVVSCGLAAKFYLDREAIKREVDEYYGKNLELTKKYGKVKGKEEDIQEDFKGFFILKEVLVNERERTRLRRTFKDTIYLHGLKYIDIYDKYEDTVSMIKMIKAEFERIFGKDTITTEKFVSVLEAVEERITKDIIRVGNSILGRVNIDLKAIDSDLEVHNENIQKLIAGFIELDFSDLDAKDTVEEQVRQLTKELKYYKR